MCGGGGVEVGWGGGIFDYIENSSGVLCDRQHI